MRKVKSAPVQKATKSFKVDMCDFEGESMARLRAQKHLFYKCQGIVNSA